MEKPPAETNILACFQMEREILLWLLERCDDIDDWPWRGIEEVMGTTSDPITALDAMAALADKGLVRRKGEFVMATSVAYAFYQLIGWQSA
jgi:hypothetical protein